MQGLEQKLQDIFTKQVPFQLPEDLRKTLVGLLPWLTLIGGVLMLFAAWSLYRAVTYVSDLAGLATGLGAYYGVDTSPISTMSPLLWLSLAILVVEAVLFFMAYPALKSHKKSGWNILFYVSLVNLAQALVQAFAYSNVGALLGAVVSSVVGLYLLFQVRAYYNGVGPTITATPVAKTPKQTPAASAKTPSQKS